MCAYNRAVPEAACPAPEVPFCALAMRAPLVVLARHSVSDGTRVMADLGAPSPKNRAASWRRSALRLPAPFRMVRTLCYSAYMSENVSVRLEDSLSQRLRLRARAAGETLSDRLRRYADEGIRRDEHPLITFRDGPTGRRAGVVGGPDVWEVAMWVEDLSTEPDPVAALVEDLVLPRPQIDAALRYRAAYPDEIDTRIELHRQETAAASTS